MEYTTDEYQEIIDELRSDISELLKLHSIKTLHDELIFKTFVKYRNEYSYDEFELLLSKGKEFLTHKIK